MPSTRPAETTEQESRDVANELFARAASVARYRLGVDVVNGHHAWLEAGILPSPPRPSTPPFPEAGPLG